MYETTPHETAGLCQHIFAGKDVTDLGCRYGEFMKAIKPYAKSVRGIEISPNSFEIASKQDLPVENKDFLKMEFNAGEVYYCHAHKTVINSLVEKIDGGALGTFIIGQTESYCIDKQLESIANETITGCNGEFKVFVIIRERAI